MISRSDVVVQNFKTTHVYRTCNTNKIGECLTQTKSLYSIYIYISVSLVQVKLSQVFDIVIFLKSDL